MVIDVDTLDPYAFMAVLGKRTIRPGGQRSTQELIEQADFQTGQHVLDVGCGVATTAIELARRFDVHVTAVDISPLMLERAQANVQATRLADKIAVEPGDVTALSFAENTFDRVFAEAVTMFVDRPQAVREMIRVCRKGGKVLASEFFWRRPPTTEARQTFLGEVCPGMQVDDLEA